MTETEHLKWGLGYVVPTDARGAWGARAIDDGYTGLPDFLPDRSSAIGEDKQVLFDYLDKHLPIRPALSDLLSDLPRLDEVQDVFDDGVVKVQARRTGGYFYIAAWLI